MSDYEKWMRRVVDRADALVEQLSRTNMPLNLIGQHVDIASLEGTLLTLSIEPEIAKQDDLARIYIIRDGFRALLSDVHELDEVGEYSILQLATGLDSLYVETDALLRSKATLVEAAINAVENQKVSKRLPITSQGTIGRTLINASNEVINSATISRNAISMNVLHSNQVDVLHRLDVSILRLSASAFAIKVLLNSNVVYDATIKFLNDGADRVLTEIKKIAVVMQEDFSSTDALVGAVGGIVDSGTRFVRLLGSLITENLKSPIGHREVALSIRSIYKTSTILAGVTTQEGAVLGGRQGTLVLLQADGRMQTYKVGRGANILSAAALSNSRIALGTDEGLFVWAQRLGTEDLRRSSMSDKFVACLAHQYNGNETIITASADGGLRRWWTPGGELRQLRDDIMTHRDVKNKVGKRIKALLEFKGQLIVAVDSNLFVLDDTFDEERKFVLPTYAQAACIANDRQIVVVGEGMIAIVNFSEGRFVQSHGVPDDAEYVAVTRLSDTLTAVASPAGMVRAIDMSNGAELGEIDVGFEVRGLTIAGKFLVAYGGNWHREGKSIALILWEDRLVSRGAKSS